MRATRRPSRSNRSRLRSASAPPLPFLPARADDPSTEAIRQRRMTPAISRPSRCLLISGWSDKAGFCRQARHHRTGTTGRYSCQNTTIAPCPVWPVSILQLAGSASIRQRPLCSAISRYRPINATTSFCPASLLRSDFTKACSVYVSRETIHRLHPKTSLGGSLSRKRQRCPEPLDSSFPQYDSRNRHDAPRR